MSLLFLLVAFLLIIWKSFEISLLKLIILEMMNFQLPAYTLTVRQRQNRNRTESEMSAVIMFNSTATNLPPIIRRVNEGESTFFLHFLMLCFLMIIKKCFLYIEVIWRSLFRSRKEHFLVVSVGCRIRLSMTSLPSRLSP